MYLIHKPRSKAEMPIPQTISKLQLTTNHEIIN